MNLIDKTIAFVKEKLEGAEAGHDWFHIERVWKIARKIAEKEGGNLEIIELSALLHDIADPKFHNGDEVLALEISRGFLESESVSRTLWSRFYSSSKIFLLKIEENCPKICLWN